MRLTVEKGEVNKVTYCALCIKLEEELKERHNFSATFIKGISYEKYHLRTPTVPTL